MDPNLGTGHASNRLEAPPASLTPPPWSVGRAAALKNVGLPTQDSNTQPLPTLRPRVSDTCESSVKLDRTFLNPPNAHFEGCNESPSILGAASILLSFRDQSHLDDSTEEEADDDEDEVSTRDFHYRGNGLPNPGFAEENALWSLLTLGVAVTAATRNNSASAQLPDPDCNFLKEDKLAPYGNPNLLVNKTNEREQPIHLDPGRAESVPKRKGKAAVLNKACDRGNIKLAGLSSRERRARTLWTRLCEEPETEDKTGDAENKADTATIVDRSPSTLDGCVAKSPPSPSTVPEPTSNSRRKAPPPSTAHKSRPQLIQVPRKTPDLVPTASSDGLPVRPPVQNDVYKFDRWREHQVEGMGIPEDRSNTRRQQNGNKTHSSKVSCRAAAKKLRLYSKMLTAGASDKKEAADEPSAPTGNNRERRATPELPKLRLYERPPSGPQPIADFKYKTPAQPSTRCESIADHMQKWGKRHPKTKPEPSRARELCSSVVSSPETVSAVLSSPETIAAVLSSPETIAPRSPAPPTNKKSKRPTLDALNAIKSTTTTTPTANKRRRAAPTTTTAAVPSAERQGQSIPTIEPGHQDPTPPTRNRKRVTTSTPTIISPSPTPITKTITTTTAIAHSPDQIPTPPPPNARKRKTTTAGLPASKKVRFDDTVRVDEAEGVGGRITRSGRAARLSVKAREGREGTAGRE